MALNSVAFYLSGQLLTEDYYVANKLMKGFIGSANVDTNSRLCMASSVAGHSRAFGSDMVPGCYEDLDEADLIVLVGSNAAWCHPVLYQRMMAAQRRARHQDSSSSIRAAPRRRKPPTCTYRSRPAWIRRLFSGLLVYLAEHGALDEAISSKHTIGLSKRLARAREMRHDRRHGGRHAACRRRCCALLRAVRRDRARRHALFSQGVNQSAQGTDKVNAIMNCHLATGRIGRPGMGPFSLTGQPNAMGGREVGGLANQLAAHMGFSPPKFDRVRRFWNAPRMATRRRPEGGRTCSRRSSAARSRRFG